MIVVHLCRKPVVGTISGNCRDHGTGALDIDSSRIRMDAGTALAHRGSTPDNRKGEVGKDFGFARTSKEKMEQAQRESIDRTNRLGRWPSNVCLQHRDSCVNEGTRTIKGNRADTRPEGDGGREDKSQWRFRPTEATRRGYAGEDGTETAAAWVCALDCPVAEMERQSLAGGCHPAGGHTAGHPERLLEKKKATGPTPIAPVNGACFRYGDTGGSARFFKQFGGSHGE